MGHSAKFGVPYPPSHKFVIVLNYIWLLHCFTFLWFLFSVSSLFAVGSVEISFTSYFAALVPEHGLYDRKWPLFFLTYFIFSYISLGTLCLDETYHRCMCFSFPTAFHSVIVLVQVVSLLSSCTSRSFKSRFLMMVICQCTPPNYVCCHF